MAFFGVFLSFKLDFWHFITLIHIIVSDSWFLAETRCGWHHALTWILWNQGVFELFHKIKFQTLEKFDINQLNMETYSKFRLHQLFRILLNFFCIWSCTKFLLIKVLIGRYQRHSVRLFKSESLAWLWPLHLWNVVTDKHFTQIDWGWTLRILPSNLEEFLRALAFVFLNMFELVQKTFCQWVLNFFEFRLHNLGRFFENNVGLRLFRGLLVALYALLEVVESLVWVFSQMDYDSFDVDLHFECFKLIQVLRLKI